MTVKTHLYRHFDANGQLLYVGISLSALKRLSQHNSQSRWADQIANVTIETFPTRDSALAAEREAIISERPIHNRALNPNVMTLPKVPEDFDLSGFEDDGESGLVVLAGLILDAEDDAVAVSFGSDGFSTMRTSQLSYVDLDSDFNERLGNMMDAAMDWYSQVEAIGATLKQMRRAYGHLLGMPPMLSDRFRTRCFELDCNTFAPEIEYLQPRPT